METKEITADYKIREKLSEVGSTTGNRDAETMEFMQLALAYVLYDAGGRLRQCVEKERKPIIPSTGYQWRGIISEYNDPETVAMLLDIKTLISELIAVEIIHLNINDND